MKAAPYTYTSRAKEPLQRLSGLCSIVSIRPDQIFSLLILDCRLHHPVVVSVSRAAEAFAVVAMAQDSAFILPLDGEVDAFAKARAIDYCFSHVDVSRSCNGSNEMVHFK